MVKLKIMALPAALSAFYIVGQAHAQTAIGTLGQMIDSGYVYMSDMNTPLMHHVKTGDGYDLRILAAGEMGPGELWLSDDQIRKKAASKNEFDRMEVAGPWSNHVKSQVERLKIARGYIIPLKTSWKEYNFSNHRFAASFRMNKSGGWRSKSSFHCLGAYAQASNNEYLTSCVTAKNLNAGEDWLQYFQIDDYELAKDVKSNGYKYSVFALAVDDGKYQVNRGNEMRYMPLETYRVTGFQPVRIVNLILVEPDKKWNVYAFSRPIEDAFTVIDKGAKANLRDGNGNQVQASQDNLKKSPDFVAYAKNGGGVFYMDENGAKREGDIVVVKEIEDYVQPGPDNSLSRTGVYSYNCARRTWRRLGLKTYAEHMAQGALITESVDKSDGGYADNGTISAIALNNACNLK